MIVKVLWYRRGTDIIAQAFLNNNDVIVINIHSKADDKGIRVLQSELTHVPDDATFVRVSYVN